MDCCSIGPPGPTGPAGVRGDTGSQGNTGAKEDTGNQVANSVDGVGVVSTVAFGNVFPSYAQINSLIVVGGYTATPTMITNEFVFDNVPATTVYSVSTLTNSLEITNYNLTAGTLTISVSPIESTFVLGVVFLVTYS